MFVRRNRLILLVSVFWAAFANFSFFQNCLQVYPVSGMNVLFLASLAVVLVAVMCLLLNLVCGRYTTKPVLIVLLLATSCAAYFMDTYHIVIDESMILNIQQTNYHETIDLFSLRLLLYFFLLGLLPAMTVLLVRVEYDSFGHELVSRFKSITLCLLVIIAAALPQSRFYASFLREHKPLRYYTNPTYYIYSVAKRLLRPQGGVAHARQIIGLDAHIPADDKDRELIIMVVGETARADHFSLNGYDRLTNPLVSREDVVSLRQLYSCGTSTATSVPCMFSLYDRQSYSEAKVDSVENVLDVMRHAGVSVLWRENNSNSKKIAAGVQYEDFRSPRTNPVCEDGECRDEGMLAGLGEYIESIPKGDIVVVLHQMGSHGPAYWKRYPAAFEKFTPTCRTNQLEECSVEEIINTYDNTILYTDYFLSRVISLLEEFDNRFETAMIYISDHGESLGEGGMYLHSLPYFFAPEMQKHVAGILWFGRSYKLDREALRKKGDQKYSHDNVFHTLLGMLELQTPLYNPKLDILAVGEKDQSDTHKAVTSAVFN